MIDRRLQFVLIALLVVVASTLDQSILSGLALRPFDLTLVLLLAVTVSGLIWPAITLALLAGLLRGTTTVYPWFVYGGAYVLAVSVAWLVIRRVVAERATASLLASSAAGSFAYAVAFMALASFGHLLQSSAIQIPWSVVAVTAAVQSILQPWLIWFIWRVRGGGKFASVRQSLTSPF